MLAYLVAGLTATVLVTAVGWFWKQCFEDEGREAPRSPVDDTPPAPESPVDSTPPAPESTLAPTPPTSDSPLDGTPPAPDADDTPPAPDSSVDGAPPGSDSLLDGTPPAPDSPPDDAPPGSDSLLDSIPPAPDSPPDDAPPAPSKADAPAAPPAVRWSWRTHRQSGLEFLRVTVTNPGPNPMTLTGIGLRTSDELARHADPPADLLGASEQAVEMFGQDSGAAPLPHTLEPDGSVDAYFPCRDVADWLYGVAESHNLDRNECHLTPECIDGAGDIHIARRKVDYERWLRHGHGPSLGEHLARGDGPSGGGEEA